MKMFGFFLVKIFDGNGYFGYFLVFEWVWRVGMVMVVVRVDVKNRRMSVTISGADGAEVYFGGINEMESFWDVVFEMYG